MWYEPRQSQNVMLIFVQTAWFQILQVIHSQHSTSCIIYCGRLWVNSHVCQTHSCLLMFTFHSGLKNHYSSKSAFNLNLELNNNNINIKERGLSWCYLAQQWRPTKEHSPCALEQKWQEQGVCVSVLKRIKQIQIYLHRLLTTHF